MKYQNAADVLPPELLRELQKYASGSVLYVPKPREDHERWGSLSGGRKLLAERNREICRLFQDGVGMEELSSRFCLSVDSIRRIVYRKKD